MAAEGRRYTVTVEGWSSQGDGVARIDGMAVFVKGAIPGEKCVVTVEHVGHKAAWARVEALLEPAPGRVLPDCPTYAHCGGCQLRHMDYQTELSFKADKVKSALRHIGAVEVDRVPIHGAGSTSRYRNKAQLPVGAGPAVGFYQKGTHQVTDVADCLLQSEAAGRLGRGLKKWMETYAVPAYDERTRQGLVRHLYLRENAAGESLAAVVANGDKVPHEKELVEALRDAAPGLRGVLLNENTRDTNVVLGAKSRLLWGRDFLEDTLRGLTFRLSAGAFFQVNRAQTEVLYRLVGEFAALTGKETVLDLYCGAGTIGLTLAADAKEVIGVEVFPQAVEDARENAARNGVGNASFLAADAAQAAERFAQEGRKPDVIVVDPPRKGLAPQVVEAILEMSPKKLVYVSCDPATLARDLKTLTQTYRLDRVEAVDLFPRTCHVETVCLLTRAEKG